MSKMTIADVVAELATLHGAVPTKGHVSISRKKIIEIMECIAQTLDDKRRKK